MERERPYVAFCDRACLNFRIVYIVVSRYPSPPEMQIRVGYDLRYVFPQPTPVIVTLNVHYSRASDLVRPDLMLTDPPVPIRSYRDGFGNWCARLVAPEGRFRIFAEA